MKAGTSHRSLMRAADAALDAGQIDTVTRVAAPSLLRELRKAGSGLRITPPQFVAFLGRVELALQGVEREMSREGGAR